MTATLLIVFPVFAVVGLGWLSGHFRLGSESMGEALAGFVFTFAIPALLFRTIAAAQVTHADPWGYWASYFAGVATVWLLGTLIARSLYALSPAESAIAGFATGQANTVLMGIPLIVRTFGDAGAVPLFLLVAIHLPITMTAATLLVERNLGGNPGWLPILRKLLTNPILIGIGAGVAVRTLGLPLPDPVFATVRMLADAATPCALFTLGLALNKYGAREKFSLLALLSALKIVVHPLLVYVLARFVFHLPPVWIGVAVLFASSPCGINAYLLAQRYRTGVALSSGTILVSTVLSLVTTTFWVWLVALP